MNLEDWSKLIGIIAALLGGLKFLVEYSRSNRQKEDEFRWKKAELARKILDEMFGDPLSRSALRMLDWWERTYTAPDNRQFRVTTAIVLAGLRVKNMTFTHEEQFVRDCFERFYDMTDSIEHFMRAGLLSPEDVLPPLRYYSDCISKHRDVHSAFWKTYGYEFTEAFFSRFGAKPGDTA